MKELSQVLDDLSIQVYSAISNLELDNEVSEEQIEDYIYKLLSDETISRCHIDIRKRECRYHPDNLYTALLLRGIKMEDPHAHIYTDEQGNRFELGSQLGYLHVMPVESIRFIHCNILIDRNTKEISIATKD